ncbi:type IX secretion system membrane protein PorP/SprF [Ekhidna sp.]|jgi:type IX secretion system PorP/SprF family membrane protein|uniref:PorP/SprF family type IX secretion system membrane protein n=1 Tax=Ekhidna sp. TaxID=2608089 RepID=UPI0032EDB5DA
MSRLVFIVLSFLLVGHSMGQQQYVISQYMFNGLVLNPAYAGTHESWSFTLMTRNQWRGIPGAPSTQTFTAHGSVTRNNESSAGLIVSSDAFGAISLSNIYGVYAYRMNFDRGRHHLSMGLQGGATLFNVDLSNANLIDPDDPVLNNDYSSTMANFGTGIFYNGPKLYAGLSVPFLLNNRLNQSEQDLSRQVRHYYLTGGGIFPIGHDVKYKPSFLLRYAGGLADIDINTSFLFRDVIWLGVTYRVKNSIDFILEIQFTDNLRFGYSYGLVTSELRQSTSGSHEVVLNYRIKRKHPRVNHPRRFR